MNNKILRLFYPPVTFAFVVIGFVFNAPASGYAENKISMLERLANLDPKPFVVVEVGVHAAKYIACKLSEVNVVKDPFGA